MAMVLTSPKKNCTSCSIVTLICVKRINANLNWLGLSYYEEFKTSLSGHLAAVCSVNDLSEDEL